MKTLTYEREKMMRAGQLLNSLYVSGSANFRLLAELADILDSGVPGEIMDSIKKSDSEKSIKEDDNKKEGEDSGIPKTVPNAGLAELSVAEDGIEPDKPNASGKGHKRK